MPRGRENTLNTQHSYAAALLLHNTAVITRYASSCPNMLNTSADGHDLISPPSRRPSATFLPFHINTAQASSLGKLHTMAIQLNASDIHKLFMAACPTSLPLISAMLIHNKIITAAAVANAPSVFVAEDNSDTFLGEVVAEAILCFANENQECSAEEPVLEMPTASSNLFGTEQLKSAGFTFATPSKPANKSFGTSRVQSTDFTFSVPFGSASSKEEDATMDEPATDNGNSNVELLEPADQENITSELTYTVPSAELTFTASPPRDTAMSPLTAYTTLFGTAALTASTFTFSAERPRSASASTTATGSEGESSGDVFSPISSIATSVGGGEEVTSPQKTGKQECEKSQDEKIDEHDEEQETKKAQDGKKAKKGGKGGSKKKAKTANKNAAWPSSGGGKKTGKKGGRK